jgi:hypothetical protein
MQIIYFCSGQPLQFLWAVKQPINKWTGIWWKKWLEFLMKVSMWWATSMKDTLSLHAHIVIRTRCPTINQYSNYMAFHFSNKSFTSCYLFKTTCFHLAMHMQPIALAVWPSMCVSQMQGNGDDMSSLVTIGPRWNMMTLISYTAFGT